MIVDSSAIVAIVLDENDGPRMAEAIVNAARPRMSAATWVETTIVIDGKRNTELSLNFSRLLDCLKLEVVPFDRNQAEIAIEAFRRYGKGMENPARLNFGDCMAYALAKSTGEPLLYKGNDFPHTDIAPALA